MSLKGITTALMIAPLNLSACVFYWCETVEIESYYARSFKRKKVCHYERVPKYEYDLWDEGQERERVIRDRFKHSTKTITEVLQEKCGCDDWGFSMFPPYP